MIISILIYSSLTLAIFSVGNRLAYFYNLSKTDSAFENILFAINHFADKSFLVSWQINDVLTGLLFVLFLWLFIWLYRITRKKYRHGEEHGSARWGKAKDIKPFIDKQFTNNVILSQTEYLTMNSRVKPIKNGRNKNIEVVGGSGSGKTFFFVKPNIMQMHSSYVVTDPKGTLMPEVGKLLEDNGYIIKCFNLKDFNASMKYNPFAYVHSEKDILKMVNVLMSNTSGQGELAKEDFWVKAERLLLTALSAYLWSEAPIAEQNFSMMGELLDLCETREDDEDFKNAVDILFEDLEKSKGGTLAVRQYKKYKLAAGKTAKSILVSVGARLAPFDIKEVREITEYDEMDLDTLGDMKTALFVIIPDTDSTFNFLAAMMYAQLFDTLCAKADNEYHGRLPVHVRCILDEFANIGMIPNFEKLIATIRSREISACIIIQAESQLKGMYKDNAETIIGNCDTTVFLGGKEKTTLKNVSEMLGKETIDSLNINQNKGKNSGSTFNYQILGRELMTQDELAVMDGGECIVAIRGVRPFRSLKYDTPKHKLYDKLADRHPENEYKIKIREDETAQPADLLQGITEIKEYIMEEN